MAAPSSVLIIGGAGTLGRAIASLFHTRGAAVTSLDLVPCDAIPAPASILLPDLPWPQQHAHAGSMLFSRAPFSAIIVTAGAWAGGGAGAHDFPATAADMHARCLQPALGAAALAARGALAEGGLLALTGSAAALGVAPAPGMLGYWLAKRATHDLARAMGSEGGGLPARACALALAPRVIDSAANRRNMGAGADVAGWTPPDHIAEALWGWAAGRGGGARPASGSVLEAVTAGGETRWVAHGP